MELPPDEAERAKSDEAVEETLTEPKEEVERPPEPETPEEQPPREEEPAKSELEELREILMRVKADFSNYQKRVQREFATARKSGQAGVLIRFLDLLDAIHRTNEEADKYSDFASLRQAVSMITSEAERLARDSGLERIPTVGRPFDPAVHEAMMVRETEDHPDSCVVEEVRPGYFLDGKVLRHAQVVVAKRSRED